MKKYTVNEAKNIIISAAKEYEKKLNNKHFRIIYQDKKEVKMVEVGFRDINFLHLTGVATNLSAQVFYSACISGKLSVKDFSIDNKGKVQQKMMVLPYLSDLLYNNCMIGDFVNSGICIKADYFVGNTKAILSVGFKFGTTVDFPVTLYNESVKTLVKPVNRVLAIFSKEYNCKVYDECTYWAKNMTIDSLPEFVKQCICDETLKSVNKIGIDQK